MRESIELLLESPWFYLLALVLAGTYFYFKKKFENLADKEDISEITRNVESVKKEFNEDIEKLKVKLDIIKSHQINLVNEKREAIYDFWNTANFLLENLTSIFNFDINDLNSYKEFKKHIDKSYEDYVLNRHSFELKLHEFIDEELQGLISDFSKLIIKKRRLLFKTGLEIVDFRLKLKNKEVELDTYSNILDVYSLSSESLMDELLTKLYSIKGKMILIIETLHK